jgi:hypothetical protein
MSIRICETLDNFVFVNHLTIDSCQESLLLSNESLGCRCVETAISTLAVANLLQVSPNSLLKHLEAVFSVLRIELG